MSDVVDAIVQAAGGAGDGGAGGAGGVGDQGDGGQDGGAPQRPAWMADLPDKLRESERLARYKTTGDLAAAYVEIEQWASGRVALPKDDDAASFAEFAGKLRPESADKYVFGDDAGSDAGMLDWFRGSAFEAGLHPRQAQMLATAWNQHAADAVAQMKQAAGDELKAFEIENPANYARSNLAIEAMLRGAGVDLAEDATAIDALQQAFGAGKAWQFLAHMARATGELEKIDGGSVELQLGTMTPEQASAKADAMMRDPAIAAKLLDKTSPEARMLAQLQQLRASA